MKKMLVLFCAVAFIACNNQKTGEAAAEAKPMVPADMHGITPSYSASFVMDSAKNTETILALWADWKSGDLSKSRIHFADTAAFFLSDGSSMMGPTDTLIKGMQAYRSSFAKMEANVEAVFAVKCTDKNENWVAIWGNEIQTNQAGKVDTVSLQETWRFNKEGKVNMMFQAMRKGVLPPPPGK